MGRKYAGPARWAANVAKILKVPVSTSLRGFLCDGDLDVPPAIDFSKLKRRKT
jgi:hypothetical protein